MTPKEKADELVNKYSIYVVMWAGGIEVTGENVKQCALIAVDELIKESCKYSLFKNADSQESRIAFFTEVKQEIEKL